MGIAIDKKQVSLGLIAGALIGATVFGTFAVRAQGDIDETDSGEAAVQNMVRPHGRGQMLDAELLGLGREEFRDQVKENGLEDVVKNSGFESMDAFFLAVDEKVAEKLAEEGFSQQEIDERLTHMAEHRKMKQDMDAVREAVLGMSREDIHARLEAGESMQEIVSSAGFEDRSAVEEAVKSKLVEMWQSEGLDQQAIDQRLEKFEDRMEKGPHGERGHRREFGPHREHDDDGLGSDSEDAENS